MTHDRCEIAGPSVTGQQQAAIAASSPLYLDACPGAGKTFVLVERHLATPVGRQRRGRALISFTNRAADEIRRRCHRLDLLEFPHFTGTLDAFLWHFLVRPFLKENNPPWQRIMSWAEVGSSDAFKVFGRLPLASFDFGYDVQRGEVVASLPDAQTKLTNAQRTEAEFISGAKALRDSLWRKHHYFTSLELRIMALENAADPQVRDVLKARFSEIVIDEAQDCTELDIAILGRLHAGGVPLVVVADPNQAIYEYQGATPAVMRTLTSRIGRHLTLSDNHRCSQRICDLAATMRPGKPSIADRAAGPWREDQTPVLLVPFADRKPDKQKIRIHSKDEAASVFVRYASTLDPACEDVLSLAWAQAAVPSLDKVKRSKAPTDGTAWMLAWARAVYRNADADHQDLQNSMKIAVSILIRYWYPDSPGNSDRVLAAHGIDAITARRYAGSLLASLPDVDNRPAGDWIRDARKRVIDHPAPADAEPAPAKGFRLTTGGRNYDRSETIAAEVGLGDEARELSEDLETIRITSTTIHKAKGGEADAVLVAMPGPKALKQLLSAWRDHTTDDSEILRVYYVAVTRARRLVGFTYPYSSHSEMVGFLDSLHVEFSIALECEVIAPTQRRRQRHLHGPAGMEAIPGLAWGE